jgi:hypothetical protein
VFIPPLSQDSKFVRAVRTVPEALATTANITPVPINICKTGRNHVFCLDYAEPIQQLRRRYRFLKFPASAFAFATALTLPLPALWVASSLASTAS